ncbi:MAG: GntR family transcriptional regulator [Gemmataceae bacterium]
MNLRLDPSGGEPLFAQIARQVRAQVAAGRMPPGRELPPIRALAGQLVVNPNTVVKAYAQLESEGVLVKRSTAGTFVADDGPAKARVAGRAVLTLRVDQLLAEAAMLGLSYRELTALLRERHGGKEADGE